MKTHAGTFDQLSMFFFFGRGLVGWSALGILAPKLWRGGLLPAGAATETSLNSQ